MIRVRPPLPREINSDTPFQNTIYIEDEQQIFVSDNIKEVLDDQGQLLSNPGPWTTHTFMFDHVYDEKSTQLYVYDNTAKNVVESALLGYNATIFAYGQTGTGKTFTMEGFTSEESVEARGIIPRAIEQIFHHIQINASGTMKYLVRASYLQIYNEQISDLLKPERSNLTIREDKKKGVYVEGLSEWVVRSPAEIYGLMEKGGMVRATGETKMNKVSSRSHAVFVVIAEQSEIVYVDQQGNQLSQEDIQQLMHTRGVRSDKDMTKLDDHKKQAFKVGKLNLVDLAGSERVRMSGAVGQRLEESKQINRSLSALGNVISALTDSKNRQHIPYRDSKLTRMLEDSLGGNCKTTMMAMVSPAMEAMTETVSTLKFANRAKNIRNEARVNEDLDQKSLLRKYEKELKFLRAELESKNRDVVDKRRLLEIDDQRRRAEADKMAAIKALEARSLEFMREKEEKRKLELRISKLMGQMIRGEGDLSNTGEDFAPRSMVENAKLRQEYEGKLASLEQERETIEEEKAQVDKYKTLLLKQRDIMIALTQRLVERDEQIMHLQEEVDTYDTGYRQLEETLDLKSALLIKLQRISMEINDMLPYKNEELASVLNEFSFVMNKEKEKNNAVSNYGGEATEIVAVKSRTDSGYEPISSALQEENLQLLSRIRQLEAQVAAAPSIPTPLPPTPITQRNGDLGVQKDTRGMKELEEVNKGLMNKCNTLVQERIAVQTIMEHKINVLVQNVSKSVAGVLQVNPLSSSNPIGAQLARDMAALERMVNASVAALKNTSNMTVTNGSLSATSNASSSSPRSPIVHSGKHFKNTPVSPTRMAPPPPSL